MSARPIVLLHGAGESGCYFDPLRGELARAFSGADFRVEGSEAGASALARPRSPRGRLARDLPNGLVPISYGYLTDT